MMQRVRQFYRAMTADITPADRAFVDKSIPKAAQPLFYAMHPADQYHALHVARTALALADMSDLTVDRSMLLRCALLHDVGRVRGDLDVWGKVFTVLMDRFLPRLAEKLACPGGQGLWSKPGHAIYVYYHHAEIGAAKLRAIGLTGEAALIARHHQPPAAGDAPELCLLREADERN
ncbi:HDIG domain-containing protein [Selenomonas caprae]|uniref:HDIG domain-containing protein n=1 Tax=Selenomonas caprae TaxID=2606905 RepID=A0A5D6WR21_9FIRM|nr:HDIG domain-containing metalloprotein [Selenomonas caprae]TYZ30290.1 HDIG domain-containing protein [Selenomonas caprae]